MIFKVSIWKRCLRTLALGCCAVASITILTQDLRADTPQAPPTLRELIEKSKDQPDESSAADVPRLGIPEDPLGRGVPRTSVKGFLIATRNHDYVRAAEYLDLRNLPSGMTEQQGPDLARQLKIVLDRAFWVDLDVLSSEPEGDDKDNLLTARDRVGFVSTADRKYEILVQRVPRGDGVYIWKFSALTVADIPGLYADFGYGPLERVFPPWLFDTSVFGIHLWTWIVFIVLGILLYPVAMVIVSSALHILRRFYADLADQIERFFGGPLRLLVWTVLGRYGAELIGSSVAAKAIMQSRTVQMVGLAWMLMRLVDFLAQRASTDLDRKGLAGARVILTPVARLLKLLAVTGATLMWLDNVGYKVTTLLAGLSISGVAVALASQKSLENIFGALTLFTAQPVKVGDFCRFGDKMGTVEEIGLRATRVRTVERSVISIANAEFAGMHLDNLSKRDRFLFNPCLQLRYETTPDQIRFMLIEVRTMLYAHPKMLSDPLWVRFTGFGEYSLNLQVFAYIGVTDYNESLEIAEDVNFRIMDIVEAAGSDFAFPAQIEYSLPGKPFDENRAKAIGARVKEWKDNRALYLPNVPKEKIAHLKASLDYPPAGSPEAMVGR